MKNVYTICLAGNPNVGKTTIFNKLTNKNQHTGNWAGKTVGIVKGSYKLKENKYILVDIPGTYSISANSEDEEIARNYLFSENIDCTVIVLDATNLERNLNLVFQILEKTNNVIICLNLMDEAYKKGIQIDRKKLEEKLGVPVIETIAYKRNSIQILKHSIKDMCNCKTNDRMKKVRSNEKSQEEQEVENLKKAENIVKDVVIYKESSYNDRDRKIDKIVTSKIWGIPIMLFFLALIFWITIKGANYPSNILVNIFNYIENKLQLMCVNLHVPEFIKGILIDGMYRTTTWVISVMLPPMAIFFPLFTLVEELGFLPRIAFNMDNLFKKAGTTGKQALTMCMGFGCNAAGIVGCRIMETKREKIIAMLTNTFVPCNGRFPFLITISSIFIGGLFATNVSSIFSTVFVVLVVLFGIFMTIEITKLLSKTILKGESSSFVLELPSYRKPKVIRIIKQSIIEKTVFVLFRAIIVAAPAGILIWLCANISIGDVTILTYMANVLNPIAQLMGLDGYILTGFILGLPANEIVLPIILMCYMANGSLTQIDDIHNIANILRQNGWTLLTAINVMVFSLLHFPCSTTLLTIKKESGSWKWVMMALAIPTICGIVVCMLTTGVYNLVKLIG